MRDICHSLELGRLSATMDGTIIKINATLLRWTGRTVRRAFPAHIRQPGRSRASTSSSWSSPSAIRKAGTPGPSGLEDRTGIRDRVRPQKPQRVTLSSWSFHQLGAFLNYKARRAGVPLVEVDPRYTSQTCNQCGHWDKRNRPHQETFHCRSCGVVAHADHNAALNIAQRGIEGWGAVNHPYAA